MSETLKERIVAACAAAGGGTGSFETPLDGLTLLRLTEGTMARVPMLYDPALCIVAQGAKSVTIGATETLYRENQALIVGLDLPMLGAVAEASGERPLLLAKFALDLATMRALLADIPAPPRAAGEERGAFVIDVTGPLADAMTRVIALLETPEAIPVLYPALRREVGYWLLTGPHGPEIARIVRPNSRTERIARAIRVLREDLTRPIRIDELAAIARMSPSSFHQHFKGLTAITPIQYQKRLRLLEARRLMLTDGSTAAHAAHRVGYESVSQFSREYARMFGAPPRRDIDEKIAAAA
ncbi:AraC family transcriptional regulator [Acuticoccus kandeliae]|uniref:AraC family transcriptional regulator n=1 Tax=Acuticoccus kandeliae TaxID=2073160 RepID=UPI000D3E0502|nr:AraC family transcriptional regulator [Acuticoccus kandeliae]